MIPKIIHYCWLSGDPFPPLISQCLKSWKKHLPDYEFILWDCNRLNISDFPWVQQAYEQKKYAFAADYIRLYALYHYGGIYLDTDVEVKRSFSSLLHLPYFAGTEGGGMIEAGVLGSVKGSDWIKLCLNYYEGKEFIKDNPDSLRALPKIMTEIISGHQGIYFLKDQVQVPVKYPDHNALCLFPRDFFCAKDHGTGFLLVSDMTYCIHHFAMSWVPKHRTLMASVKRLLMKNIGIAPIEKLIQVFRLRALKRLFIKYT